MPFICRSRRTGSATIATGFTSPDPANPKSARCSWCVSSSSTSRGNWGRRASTWPNWATTHSPAEGAFLNRDGEWARVGLCAAQGAGRPAGRNDRAGPAARGSGKDQPLTLAQPGSAASSRCAGRRTAGRPVACPPPVAPGALARKPTALLSVGHGRHPLFPGRRTSRPSVLRSDERERTAATETFDFRARLSCRREARPSISVVRQRRIGYNFSTSLPRQSPVHRDSWTVLDRPTQRTAGHDVRTRAIKDQLVSIADRSRDPGRAESTQRSARPGADARPPGSAGVNRRGRLARRSGRDLVGAGPRPFPPRHLLRLSAERLP